MLNLDATDLDRNEVHEVLTWIYHYDEIRSRNTSLFGNSLICAWNSIMLPEGLILGVLRVFPNVPREQSVAFLSNTAKEMFATFATDSVHQQVKLLLWARRIYRHNGEGCESLRAAVIAGLRPFRNEIVEMEEGQALMDSNEELRRDVDWEVCSHSIFAGGSGDLDGKVAELTRQDSAKAKGKMDID
jgi:hypothetical protein